jgi:flavodoxin I
MSVGLYYSTTTGKTETVAGYIGAALGVEAEDIGSASDEAILAHDAIVVGAPTWHTGADEQRSGTNWDEWLYDQLPNLDFTGKKVAIFGVGDSGSYSINFCDATGELYECFTKQGAEVIGATSADDGFDYTESKRVVDGKFVGQVFDEDDGFHLKAQEPPIAGADTPGKGPVWPWRKGPGDVDPLEGWTIRQPGDPPGDRSLRWMPPSFGQYRTLDDVVFKRRMDMKMSGNVLPEGDRGKANGRCCANITDRKAGLPPGDYQVSFRNAGQESEEMIMSTRTHALWFEPDKAKDSAQINFICASIQYQCCSASHKSPLLATPGIWKSEEVHDCLSELAMSDAPIRHIAGFDSTWLWYWKEFPPTVQEILPDPDSGHKPRPQGFPFELQPFQPGGFVVPKKKAAKKAKP